MKSAFSLQINYLLVSLTRKSALTLNVFQFSSTLSHSMLECFLHACIMQAQQSQIGATSFQSELRRRSCAMVCAALFCRASPHRSLRVLLFSRCARMQKRVQAAVAASLHASAVGKRWRNACVCDALSPKLLRCSSFAMCTNLGRKLSFRVQCVDVQSCFNSSVAARDFHTALPFCMNIPVSSRFTAMQMCSVHEFF